MMVRNNIRLIPNLPKARRVTLKQVVLALGLQAFLLSPAALLIAGIALMQRAENGAREPVHGRTNLRGRTFGYDHSPVDFNLDLRPGKLTPAMSLITYDDELPGWAELGHASRAIARSA